ncbi:MAG: hypothetical protein ACO3N3_16145 [bacterium]
MSVVPLELLDQLLDLKSQLFEAYDVKDWTAHARLTGEIQEVKLLIEQKKQAAILNGVQAQGSGFGVASHSSFLNKR